MKIALYIADGLEQIVLTPDSATEKAILDKVHDGTRALSIERGAFYGCRGGWTRWKQPTRRGMYDSSMASDDDESTMIVLRPASPTPAPQGSETPHE